MNSIFFHIKKKCRQVLGVIKTIICVSSIVLSVYSCQTDENYLDYDTYSYVNSAISYFADGNVKYKIQFGESVLGDSLPYCTDSSRLIYKVQGDDVFFNTNNLTNHFKVWQYSQDLSSLTLKIDTILTIQPEETVSLVQYSAKGTILFPPAPTLSNDDTTKTSVFFIYSDNNQPDKVRIDILAVDYYNFLIKRSIEKVGDEYKTVVAQINLTKNELSEEVIFDTNFYSEINKGLSARYFYAIYDAEGNLLQDFDTKKAKIDIETLEGLNTQYRYVIMNWPYSSESILMGSPEELNFSLKEEW